MALITAAQFREHFPYLESSGQDTLLDTFIARTGGLLALFCGWPAADSGVYTLEQTAYTLFPETHWKEERALSVGFGPIIEVTSAHVDPDWVYGSDTEISSGDIVIDNRKGLLWLKPASTKAWLSAPRGNRVVLQIGFASTPPELVALTAAATRHLLDNRTSQGITDQTYAGQSLTREEAGELIPKGVRDLLGPYINWASRAG